MIILRQCKFLSFRESLTGKREHGFFISKWADDLVSAVLAEWSGVCMCIGIGWIRTGSIPWCKYRFAWKEIDFRFLTLNSPPSLPLAQSRCECIPTEIRERSAALRWNGEKIALFGEGNQEGWHSNVGHGW